MSITGTGTLPSSVVINGGSGAVDESATVTFSDLTAGQYVTVGGLTYTSTAASTATEVAAAFANRANAYVGGVAPSPTAGTLTGTLSGFSTGANTAGALTFSSSSRSCCR